jgi:hypothetical protein
MSRRFPPPWSAEQTEDLLHAVGEPCPGAENIARPEGATRLISARAIYRLWVSHVAKYR